VIIKGNVNRSINVSKTVVCVEKRKGGVRETHKQVVEVYTEYGRERPIFDVIDTPGSGNIVRIVETAALWSSPRPLHWSGLPFNKSVPSGSTSC
jgi:hypothetical protein